VKGIICAEEGAQTSASLVGLCPAILGELYTMVGNCLVDISVF
jgi:hypothetical protein